MVNNINTATTLVGQTYTSASAAASIESDTTTGVEQNTEENNNSDLSLSTRAQKLSAIENEFFNGKSFTSATIQSLVARVYEYGLINESEFTALNGDKQDQKEASATLSQSLVSYLDELDKNLTEMDESKMFGGTSLAELQDALDSTKSMMHDIANAKKAADFKQTLNDNKQLLSQVMETDEFSDLSLDDRVTMYDAVKALTVIDKISIDKLDNSSINQYIANSKL